MYRSKSNEPIKTICVVSTNKGFLVGDMVDVKCAHFKGKGKVISLSIDGNDLFIDHLKIEESNPFWVWERLCTLVQESNLPREISSL